MPLLTKKSSFLVNFVVASVIALCALNPKNVVDAAPRERKTKKTKKEKSEKGGGGVRELKCSKGSKKTKKKANAVLEDKYEYLGVQVDLRYGGMYLLLDPPVDQLVALERFDTGDESCPEQVVSTCMETCEGTTDCTAFHVFNGLPWDVGERANDDSGAYQWYCIGVNGLLQDTPITKSTAQPEFQLYISYTLTSALAEQGIPDYVAANLTEGSSEHNAYFVPAFGCVATQGFTTVTPDYVAAQACQACLATAFSVIGSCDETAAAICATDGGILGPNAILLPDGSEDCNEKCGPELCYDLIRMAALVQAGGPITQCPVRDIYDAGLGRDLKPYTCPWMDQTPV